MNARRLLIVLALLAGCSLKPAPSETIGSLPSRVTAPADNPIRPETVELGRALFWDPILSGDRDVACATCHHPDFGYGDGLAVSIGVGGRGVGPARGAGPGARVARNSMSVLATAFNGLTVEGAVAPEMAPMFWDHRTASLEEQALGPVKNELEMRGDGVHRGRDPRRARGAPVERPEYVAMFEAAFGDEGVSATTLAKAIAAFERTPGAHAHLVRSLHGGRRPSHDGGPDPRHARLHRSRSARCRSGPMLSDFKLHRLPVAPGASGLESTPDLGDGTGQFRTPTLRMITLTAPYMHNGSVTTLDESIDFYHNLEVTTPLLGATSSHRSEEVTTSARSSRPSDGTFDRTIPARVPSGLPPGGR